MAGDQFAEQNAERVDVGRGCYRRATALFGCRVGGRKCGQVRLHFLIVVEQLGDTEIQQLDLTVFSDQHVGGFQIAMDDQGAMCRLDGATNLLE